MIESNPRKFVEEKLLQVLKNENDINNSNNNIRFFIAARGWKFGIFYMCLVLAQGCRKGDPQT